MRYVHTNLVARDWRRLAAFYVEAFGCVPMPPERDLSGAWLDRATGVEGARIRGVHLRLPGYGDGGPTLEVFQYKPEEEAEAPAPNRPGLGHLAFAVEDVEATIMRVQELGGGALGETVEVGIPGVGGLRFAYLTDPEGNIVEVQRRVSESSS
ncbi:glyoxalase [Candidatus Bathyarchaeota archaeon RBG_16_57_9]|nr:MAG: glyoxalase [Candidatus Bathyarchaeota archaeon RBG_16_57_9]OGD54588.1 MAG: glyoxalase [Candidatus Bathyarchaeota archaeon RBG_13_60_20]